MSTGILADPFTDTVRKLRADWPEKFALEVDEHVFRNVGSFERANEISAKMEGMKAAAVEMGYEVFTHRLNDSMRWRYSFRLRPGFMRPVHVPKPEPKPVASLPPGPKELDEFLDGPQS